MGHMIRQSINIKGIKIGKEKNFLQQYADDTVLFLDGSEKSLKSALDLLFQFSKFSGLKPNINNTKAIWIGSMINSQVLLCQDTGLQWTSEPFTVLGVTYTANLENMEHLNFNEKFNLVQKEKTQWSKRNISPIGRITVVKSLFLSKFTRLFTVLPKPNSQWIKKLEQVFYKYIWGNKIDKVSRKTLQLGYDKGGCRMVHIDTYIKSLKLTWIRRLLHSNSEWSMFFNEVINCNTANLIQFGSKYSKQKANSTTNLFWKETLSYFADFLLFIEQKCEHDILLEPLWFNEKISVQNNYIFYKSYNMKRVFIFYMICWISRGILLVMNK